VLRLGTRRSALALHQTHLVRDALATLGVESELVTFDTVGDRVLDRALSALGGKGLFTAELEAALRDGGVDLCVHSLKDLPTGLPDDIAALAVLAREDPRDVLVGPRGRPVRALDALPPGARIGTCALRRRAQLAEHHPHLAVLDLRATSRRGSPSSTPAVTTPWCSPGPGSCASASARGSTRGSTRPRGSRRPARAPSPSRAAPTTRVPPRSSPALHHRPTGVAVAAERAFLRTLEGGCSVPVGALTMPTGDGLALHGLVADPVDGRAVRGREPVDAAAPEAAGEALAERLLGAGAGDILRSLRDAPAAVGAERAA
jgi:hydroxymethylbilane synthase